MRQLDHAGQQQPRTLRGLKSALLAVAMCVSFTAFANTEPGAAAALPLSNFSTLHVKPADLDAFLHALQANAAHARHEPGNLSFTVFQSVDSPATLFVLEQWRDQAAYEAHLKQPTLLAMHEVAKQDLDGSIGHMHIVSATHDAGLQPARVKYPSQTSNVLVFLTVKPAEMTKFNQDVTGVTPTFRAAPGNLAFDIYQDADAPTEMLQLERWTSDATHEANLKRPVIATIRAGYAVTLAKPMTSGHVIVRDVTTGAALHAAVAADASAAATN